MRSRLVLLCASGLLAAPLLAQQVQCSVSVANPSLLRAESLAETVADVVLFCTGGTPVPVGQPVPKVDFQIFLNTNFTGRLLDANGATEALLLINDPVPLAQVFCPGNSSCTSAANVFQGVLVAPNSIKFFGVPVNPPGSNATGLTLRITNIRANTNTIGVALPNAPPAPVIETIETFGGNVSVFNPNQTVGFVAPGLNVSSFGQATLQQCVPATLAQAATVTIGAGFPTAFKTRGGLGATPIPGTVNNTESGFIPNPNVAPAGIGQADSGTRFKLTVANLPSGVTVYVPTTIRGGTLPASGTAVLTATESGPFSAVVASGGTGGTLAAVTGGVAVYEVTGVNPTSADSYTVPLYVSYSASGLGTATVAVSFAPTSLVTQTCTGCSIPRFVNTGTAMNAFTIGSCGQIVSLPLSLSFNLRMGTATQPQFLAITSNGGVLVINATTSASWLSVTPASTSTPAVLSVSVNPSLAAGTYSANILVSGPEIATPLAIPVTASVTAVCTYSLLPSPVPFSAAAANGSVLVFASSGCTWSAVSDSSWLNFISSSGTGSGTVSFSVSQNPGASRSGTISVSGLDGFSQAVTITQPGASLSDTDFITRLYQYILARPPDAAGLSFWQLQLRFATRGSVADQFLRSPEYAGYGLFIVSNYLGVLGREPELGGYQFWFNQMRAQGKRQIDVTNGFLSSPEYLARFGNPDVPTFVTELYNNVLGRNPDPSGFQFWTSLLNTGQQTRPQVVQGFVSSPEFQATTLSQLYVELAYFALLNRAGTPAELASGKQALAGQSSAAFLDTIVNGAEFLSRP